MNPGERQRNAPDGSMSDATELLRRLYRCFNTRDIDAVLAMMRSDVVWANGMEGGYVHGRDGVRAYWTRQWAVIDPHVEPVRFASGADGEVVVEVQHTVRDLEGKVLSERLVSHIFRIENGMVRRFDI